MLHFSKCLKSRVLRRLALDDPPPHPSAVAHIITGWWYTSPSEKRWSSSVGMMKFPIDGKMKNVPNHQPDNIL
jgi:hypothetical protein